MQEMSTSAASGNGDVTIVERLTTPCRRKRRVSRSIVRPNIARIQRGSPLPDHTGNEGDQPVQDNGGMFSTMKSFLETFTSTMKAMQNMMNVTMHTVQSQTLAALGPALRKSPRQPLTSQERGSISGALNPIRKQDL